MSTPIAGISSMATKQLLATLADDWRRAGAGDVRFESVGGVDAAKRVAAGEAFDLVVLAADAIDELAATGRLIAASVRPLVQSPVAIAVRAGCAAPAIDTEAALRAAVLAAGSIGCSTGPSGHALHRLFERWGIADQVRSRIVQPPPGTPVGALLARGEVALGFQQLSELMHVGGIDVIGAMPAGLEIVTTFSGAVCALSAEPGAALSFLDFVRSPAATEAKRHRGMQPA